LAQVPSDLGYNIKRFLQPAQYLPNDHPDQFSRGNPGLSSPEVDQAVDRMAAILNIIDKDLPKG
jgi:hypothetical protein